MRGVKQVYPGRYLPDALARLIEREKVTFSHCVSTLVRDGDGGRQALRRRPEEVEGDHRGPAFAALPRCAGPGGGDRRLRRIRLVRDVPDSVGKIDKKVLRQRHPT
jgi:hypothetical protein